MTNGFEMKIKTKRGTWLVRLLRRFRLVFSQILYSKGSTRWYSEKRGNEIPLRIRRAAAAFHRLKSKSLDQAPSMWSEQ
jgi:hypothetical protein